MVNISYETSSFDLSTIIELFASDCSEGEVYSTSAFNCCLGEMKLNNYSLNVPLCLY